VDVKNRGVITFGELKEGLRRYGTGLEDSEISDIIMEAVSSCLVYTSIFTMEPLSHEESRNNGNIIPAVERNPSSSVTIRTTFFGRVWTITMHYIFL
jgi:hypothetical protein